MRKKLGIAAALIAILGSASGRHLVALAHNRDPRPVQVGRRRRSIGSQRALGRRPKTAADIEAIASAPNFPSPTLGLTPTMSASRQAPGCVCGYWRATSA